MKLPGEPCESVSLNASCLRLRRDLQVTPIIVGYSKHLQYFFSPSTSVNRSSCSSTFFTHFVSLPISFYTTRRWIHSEEEPDL